MKKLSITFILLFLSLNVLATSRLFEQLTPEEEAARSKEMFEQADLVFSVGSSKLPINYATEHSVQEVWKGEIGVNVFIKGLNDYSETYQTPGNVIIYAMRSVENSPVEVFYWISPYIENEAYHLIYPSLGNSYEPSKTYLERSYNPIFINWPLFYIFLSLVLGSIGTSYFIKFQTKRK